MSSCGGSPQSWLRITLAYSVLPNRSASILAETAQQQDYARLRCWKCTGDRHSRLHQADDAEDRRGVDAFAEGLVVEADVAAGDGRFEERAGFGDAFDGFDQLRHDFGAFGIAEVEVVGRGDGQRAGGREVAAAFGHGEFRAFARIEIAVAAVAVERHGDRRDRSL